jgi:hypothetical protein
MNSNWDLRYCVILLNFRHYMEVNGQLHAPTSLLSARKGKFPIAIGQEAGADCKDAVVRERTLPLAGDRT